MAEKVVATVTANVMVQDQSATITAKSVTEEKAEEPHPPQEKEQGENEGRRQKSWAEVVHELRPRTGSSSSEGDTSPTQAKNGNEKDMHKTVQGLEQEPQEM